MNHLDSLRRWLRECPALAGSGFFGADYLKEDAGALALCSTPSELRTRENILGETEPLPAQAEDFELALRAPYGARAGQELDNLERFGAVAAWIRAQNAAGRFPEWDGGGITAIVPTLTPEITERGVATARYRIRLRVKYHIKESED